jgi:hypothetical protein
MLESSLVDVKINAVMVDQFFLLVRLASQNVVYKGVISVSFDSYIHSYYLFYSAIDT